MTTNSKKILDTYQDQLRYSETYNENLYLNLMSKPKHKWDIIHREVGDLSIFVTENFGGFQKVLLSVDFFDEGVEWETNSENIQKVVNNFTL